MDNTELNVEKLAAELAGNTMMDETSVNDQTYQQIVAFLKTEKMNMFRYTTVLETLFGTIALNDDFSTKYSSNLKSNSRF